MHFFLLPFYNQFVVLKHVKQFFHSDFIIYDFNSDRTTDKEQLLTPLYLKIHANHTKI